MSAEINESEIKLQIVQALSTAMKDKLDQNKIDEICKAFVLIETSGFYKATFSISRLIFETHITVYLSSTDRTFNGKGDALGTPGWGKYWGKCYTSDYEKLLRYTTNYWANTFVVDAGILFFDEHNSLLGFFIGTGASTVVSGCAGKGAWDVIE
ncbi:VapA/VapB family virulence-associated protein [Xenorhabdus sp. Flor]|uniref:VapA/VapB family virulence-associated protein n=1 Tax=Xenorhabdus cabanillasii TaxID=351673 RepID=UPI0019BE5CFE|nr:VapA/VapB family virulence-associated protein [Xenorhabdus sp. Flor]MBD2813861.1 VapA/VapB family virulence-associated protein [Xenorhabdus sp. Flor]